MMMVVIKRKRKRQEKRRMRKAEDGTSGYRGGPASVVKGAGDPWRMERPHNPVPSRLKAACCRKKKKDTANKMVQ